MGEKIKMILGTKRKKRNDIFGQIRLRFRHSSNILSIEMRPPDHQLSRISLVDYRENAPHRTSQIVKNYENFENDFHNLRKNKI